MMPFRIPIEFPNFDVRQYEPGEEDVRAYGMWLLTELNLIREWLESNGFNGLLEVPEG